MTLIPVQEQAGELTLTSDGQQFEVAAFFGDDAKTKELIEIVKAKASELLADPALTLETAKGRKEIISIGEKVRKTRIVIEKKLKDHNDTILQVVKSAKARGDKVTAELNLLIEDIQKPAKDINDAEDKRKEGLRNSINVIKGLKNLPFDCGSDEIQRRIAMFSLPDPVDWKEFAGDAQAAKDETLAELNRALSSALNREALQRQNAELAAKLADAEKLAVQGMGSAPPATLTQEKAETPPQIEKTGHNGVLILQPDSPIFPIPGGPRQGVTIPPQPKSEWAADTDRRNRAAAIFRAWCAKEMNMYERDADFIFLSVELGEMPFVKLDVESLNKV